LSIALCIADTYWKAAPAHSILKIRKNVKGHTGNASVPETFEVELACEGSAFVFAVGFKWFLTEGASGVPVQIPDGE